jgi:hypothetical protein
MVVGKAIETVIDFTLGAVNASAQNRAADEQAKALTARAKAVRSYNNRTGRSIRKFEKDGIKILKGNIKEQYAYNDQTAWDSWRYQMGINNFNYAQEQRAYQLRQQTALQQLDFNNLALDFSMQDTARWEQEQNLQLDFQEKSTMMEFQYAQRGLQLDFAAADIARQQTLASGQLQQQQAYVQGLKQAGQAIAGSASGVTAEKLAAASIAETGLTTSQIIQSVMNAEQNFGLTSAQIGTKLEQLNDTFYLSKAQLAASRLSLDMQADAIRRDAMMQKFQADLNAITSIGLEPAIPPALPEPRSTPIPKLQKPAPWIPLPKVEEFKAQKTNPFMAGALAAAPAIGSAIAGSIGNNIKAPVGKSSYTPAVGGSASADYSGAVQQLDIGGSPWSGNNWSGGNFSVGK